MQRRGDRERRNEPYLPLFRNLVTVFTFYYHFFGGFLILDSFSFGQELDVFFFFSFSCCFVGIRSFHWMVPDIYLSYWIYAFLSAVFGLFELRFSAVVLPTSHMINFPPITWVFTLMLRSISICFGRIGLTILTPTPHPPPTPPSPPC